LKVTPKFLNDFGSGVDINDDLCMRGYEFLVSILDKQNGEGTVKQLQEETKNAIEAGTIDEYSGRKWLLWSYNLTKNPHAIDYWNNAEYLDEFRVIDRTLQKKHFTDLESLKLYKKELIDQGLANSFERNNVLKIKAFSPTKFSTISVKNIEEITEGFSYKVFDEMSGVFLDFEFAESVISKINFLNERLAKDLENEIVIEQKIRDPEEGFTAWKRIEP
jgi:hypothetical protein